MRCSCDTQFVALYAALTVGGRMVTLPDPSGGTFNAAGDFDRLLPVPAEDFPVLARIDPYADTAIPNAELAALASEVAQLLRRANDGAERRGLLRLLT
jgi:hypothetical protein